MVVRPARPDDGPAFLELVHCLADFEKLSPPTPEAGQRLLAHAFGDPPLFQLWMAEAEGRVVAYAAWFLTYSTFRARPTLYLEDLFVHPDARRKGAARQMLAALKLEAEARGCGRFEWSVLDWNAPAIALYESFGASELAGWKMMRIDLD